MGIRRDEKNIFRDNIKRVDEAKKEITRLYAKKLIEIRNLINQTTLRILTGDNLLPTLQQEKRLKALYKQVDEAIKELRSETRAIIRSKYIQNFDQSYYETGYVVEKEINLNPSKYGLRQTTLLNYPVLPREAILATFNATVAGLDLDQRLTADALFLRNRLRTEIASALVDGISTREFAKRINKIKDTMKGRAGNATVTARTELLRAHSLGLEESIKQAEAEGVEFEFEWDATLDSRTREDHTLLDKTKANEDGLFTFPSGGTTKGPRLSGIAKQDIQCRCSKLSFPFGIKPTKRTSKVDGKYTDIPFTTSYTKWRANTIKNSK